MSKGHWEDKYKELLESSNFILWPNGESFDLSISEGRWKLCDTIASIYNKPYGVGHSPFRIGYAIVYSSPCREEYFGQIEICGILFGDTKNRCQVLVHNLEAIPMKRGDEPDELWVDKKITIRTLMALKVVAQWLGERYKS